MNSFEHVEEEMTNKGSEDLYDLIGQLNTDMSNVLMMLGKTLREIQDNPLVMAAHIELNAHAVDDDPDNVPPLLKQALILGSVGAHLSLVRSILINCLGELKWAPLMNMSDRKKSHGLLHALDIADPIDCKDNTDRDTEFATSIGAGSITDFRMEIVLGMLFEENSITAQLMDGAMQRMQQMENDLDQRNENDE